MGFESMIEPFALDNQALLIQAGLPSSTFDTLSPDLYLPLAKIERLYFLTEQASGCFDLAARLGSQQQLTPLLGVLGFVMQQSNTVGEALKNLQHYFSFQLQGAFLQLNIEGQYASISFIVQDAMTLPSIRHAAEFALAAGVSILKSFCFKGWTPTLVEFVHKNDHLENSVLKNYFLSDIRFEQERNAILFPASDLLQPLHSSEPKLNQILALNLKQLEAQYTNNFSAQVEQLIYQALSAGHCKVNIVAKYMGMHRRTLHRHLKHENTSYAELLDKVRKNLALTILAQTNMSLSQLSVLLCYSEPSAFSRAFKQWFKLAPNAWRKENKIN